MTPLFFCIGTDRSTGDSLGPLVGLRLKELGYDVFGTIHEPVHATNLTDFIAKIPAGRTVIAIDACLGQASNIGTWKWKEGPLKPGAGVHKDLPAVGDSHITGTVNVGGFMPYFVIQNTRLSIVMTMAEEIVAFIRQNYPIAHTTLHVV